MKEKRHRHTNIFCSLCPLRAGSQVTSAWAWPSTSIYTHSLLLAVLPRLHAPPAWCNVKLFSSIHRGYIIYIYLVLVIFCQGAHRHLPARQGRRAACIRGTWVGAQTTPDCTHLMRKSGAQHASADTPGARRGPSGARHTPGASNK